MKKIVAVSLTACMVLGNISWASNGLRAAESSTEGGVVTGQGVDEGALDDVVMGQSDEGEISLLPEDVGDVQEEDLFGDQGGYIHPYLTLSLAYTDNLYNLDDDKTENLLTVLSPGIWFALPRKKVIPITITPHNSSPGGLQVQLEDYEGTDRFQAYALGGLDFKFYSEDSDLNATDGILEGMFRYNMRGGLALQLVDRYTHGEDILEFGSSTRDQVRTFDSNFFMATADWDITEKLRAQLDYYNFYLGYDDELNQFLDRVDNGINLYGYFYITLTTAILAEYRLVDVAYDESEELDNQSHFIFGGIKWDTTEKLSLLAKIGYQDKEYDNDDLDGFEGYAFDLQTTYRFTEKTKVNMTLYRTNEETDNFLAIDKTVIGASFNYSQEFTEKVRGIFNAVYENAEYRTRAIFTDEDREDHRFWLRPALQYLMREWLMFELAYRFDYRNSTDDRFDFDSNTFMLNVNFAL